MGGEWRKGWKEWNGSGWNGSQAPGTSKRIDIAPAGLGETRLTDPESAGNATTGPGGTVADGFRWLLIRMPDYGRLILILSGIRAELPSRPDGTGMDALACAGGDACFPG